jgi:pimeloyl-ACP methyl ester carboxylesterase
VQKTNLIGYSYLGLLIMMYAMDHPDHIERLVQLRAVRIKCGTQYPDNLLAKEKPGDPQLLKDLS